MIIEASAPPPPPQVIVIEQTNPEVIYVPKYNPTYVYGAWTYPAYPPFFIPYPPGYWFSAAVATGIAWGVGIGVRNAIWGGCNWWGRNVNINVNRYNNINVNNRIDRATSTTPSGRTTSTTASDVAYRGGDAHAAEPAAAATGGDREQFRGKRRRPSARAAVAAGSRHRYRSRVAERCESRQPAVSRRATQGVRYGSPTRS